MFCPLSLSVLVHVVVIPLVVPAGHVVHPLLVVEVPSYGLLDALLELQAGLPSELPFEFGGVDGVSHVVSGAVSDVGDEVEVSVLRSSEQPVDGPYEDVYDVDVLPLVESSDVVCLGNESFVEDGVDGARVVLDVEPVTHVLPLSVDGQRAAVPYVVDEERYEFLGELVWSVVVGAVCHDGGHAVGVVECADEVVAAGLACGVGAVRAVLGGLTEELVSVDLVCADVGLPALWASHLERPVDLVG